MGPLFQMKGKFLPNTENVVYFYNFELDNF